MEFQSNRLPEMVTYRSLPYPDTCPAIITFWFYRQMDENAPWTCLETRFALEYKLPIYFTVLPFDERAAYDFTSLLTIPYLLAPSGLLYCCKV